MQPSELSAWVGEAIQKFCASSPENSLQNQAGERAFETPIVGFSSGSDPLWHELQQDIGSFYLTPLDFFERAFPGTEVRADELTVISWILPHIAATKDSNARETSYPTDRWARGKFYGEKFNMAMRRHLLETLTNAGIPAIAPAASPFWTGAASPKYGMASNWSERHAAYVSGLGTFGLCDGLITPVGKAMRCGSVVARMAIPPTIRPYRGHHDYCLHFSHGACGQCAKRCPVGAITDAGHDKKKCVEYIHQLKTDYIRTKFGLDVDVCGLCQTGVSCESRIPAKQARMAAEAKE